MKTLRKIRKNAKALSPVVASIILIAVTVAVSIAVAAWMGALTVGFMGSSSVNINNIAFQGLSDADDNTIALSLKNTGTNTVTVATVKVNNVIFTTTPATLSMASGDASNLIVDAVDWIAGNPYKVDLYDSTGQVVGSYQSNAPA
jgi:flagellin-like protein